MVGEEEEKKRQEEEEKQQAWMGSRRSAGGGALAQVMNMADVDASSSPTCSSAGNAQLQHHHFRATS